MEIAISYTEKKIIYLVPIGFDPRASFDEQYAELQASINKINSFGLVKTEISRSGNILKAERDLTDIEINMVENYLLYFAHVQVNKSRARATQKYEKSQNTSLKGSKHIQDKYNKSIDKINNLLSSREKMIHYAVSNVQKPLTLERVALNTEEATICVNQFYKQKESECTS